MYKKYVCIFRIIWAKNQKFGLLTNKKLHGLFD